MSTGKYDYEKFNAAGLGQAFFLSFCALCRRHNVDGKTLDACSPDPCSETQALTNSTTSNRFNNQKLMYH